MNIYGGAIMKSLRQIFQVGGGGQVWDGEKIEPSGIYNAVEELLIYSMR